MHSTCREFYGNTEVFHFRIVTMNTMSTNSLIVAYFCHKQRDTYHRPSKYYSSNSARYINKILIWRVNDQQPRQLKATRKSIKDLIWQFSQLTICGNPKANIVFLLPNRFTIHGNTRLPMMALTEDTDIMNVACLRESGPLGNGELFFCNSRKLTVAQPFEAPADAINRFAVKMSNKC